MKHSELLLATRRAKEIIASYRRKPKPLTREELELLSGVLNDVYAGHKQMDKSFDLDQAIDIAIFIMHIVSMISALNSK